MEVMIRISENGHAPKLKAKNLNEAADILDAIVPHLTDDTIITITIPKEENDGTGQMET